MFNKRRLSRCIARAVVPVVSISMLFTSINVYAADDEELIRGDVKFEDMTFSGTSEADFDAIFDELEGYLQTDGNDAKVSDALDELYDLTDLYSGDACIARIYSCLDCHSEEYQARIQDYNEEWIEISDKMNVVYLEIALSDYSDILKEHIDDDDKWQDILEYEPKTEEQKALEARESELCLLYESILDKEYTTTVDGVEYNADELMNAFNAGTMDYVTVFDGYGDILRQNNQEKGEIFVELVNIRKQIAEYEGEASYAEYAYTELYDREYLPSDLDDFRESVKTYYSDVYNETLSALRGDKRDELMAIIEEGTIDNDTCMLLVNKYTQEISPLFAESFEYMKEYNLANLEVSDGKRQGAFTSPIGGAYNEPFICVDSTESYMDISSFIHEFGHFNAMYHAPASFWRENEQSLDLAEVQSQGLSLLMEEYDDELYGEYAEVFNIYNAYDGASNIVQGCVYDEFQLRAYEEEDLTVERLNEIFYEVAVSYGIEGFNESYLMARNGLGQIPDGQIYEWVNIHHSYSTPFYYISYAVSRSAVQEIMLTAEADRDLAIEQYMYIVENGCGSDSFSEVVEAAGLNNPIENPRFDEYAQVALERCGLREVDDSSDDNGTSSSGNNRPNSRRGSFASYPDGRARTRTNTGSFSSLTKNHGYALVTVAIASSLLVIMAGVMIVKAKKRRPEDEELASSNMNISDRPMNNVNAQQPKTYSGNMPSQPIEINTAGTANMSSTPIQSSSDILAQQVEAATKVETIKVNMSVNADANMWENISGAVDKAQSENGDMSVTDVRKQIEQMSMAVNTNKLEINHDYAKFAPPASENKNEE